MPLMNVPPPPRTAGGAPPIREAIASSSKIFFGRGVFSMFWAASGLLLGRPPPTNEAEAQAAPAVLFLSFVTAQAMAWYGMLLSKGELPDVPTALAEKLSRIPSALLLLAVAIEAPPLLAGTAVSMLLLLLVLELVCNSGTVDGRHPREGEPSGAILEDDDVGEEQGALHVAPVGPPPQLPPASTGRIRLAAAPELEEAADGRAPADAYRRGETSYHGVTSTDSSNILFVAGVRAFFLSASVLLNQAARPLSALEGARSQPEAIAVMFLSFVTGEAIAVYAVLISKRVVPAVSAGLAKKLSWVPLVLFLLALAIESPLLLVGNLGPMLLLLPPELVGNGGAVVVARQREGEPAGAVLEADIHLDEQQPFP
ncbi:hypothetical protein Taro_048934 [Colocasia esculenta]|uniref:Uncharacterized protein n=1 Tax=Colocasia esculenta TaxID=4460 RepID=A0A843X9H6_COLES|nr:hypothetical protein [Colocasia esculenta]